MSRRRMSTLVVVIACVAALVAAGPGQSAGSAPATARALSGPDAMDTTPRLPAKQPEHQLASAGLQRVVDRVVAGRPVARSVAIVRGDSIRVEAIAATGSRIRPAVRAVGGRVVATFRGLALADVPARRLLALERRADVAFVRLPMDLSPAAENGAADALALPAGLTSLRTGSLGSDAVTYSGLAPWHAAGMIGGGVKVGIIDSFNGPAWQAALASGEVPAQPDGVFCLVQNVGCAPSGCSPAAPTCPMWTGGEHGVGVAEVIKDAAPAAGLYLARIQTTTDYQAAIAYFKANGVRIISRSLSAPYDGPGNGQGIMGGLVDSAVSQGIASFNSAGNSAGQGSTKGGYFRSAWNDPDVDGFMNFQNGTEYLPFLCNPDGQLLLGLRWSDWAAAKTNYQMYVYDNPGEAPYDSFTDDQSVGAPPLEGAGWGPSVCGQNDFDFFAIQLAPGSGDTAGDMLEIMFNRSFFFDSFSNPFSATQPASDSANPGMASIGAVDPVNGTTIAAYSSWGPTNDGRIKPDLSAPSGMTSKTYGTFTGTSAATPLVAGAAAVILQATPTLTPAQLVAALKGAVVDRGDPGPDNVYGTGELSMPAPAAPPPPPPPPPVTSLAVKSAVLVPILRSLKSNFPVQVRWKVDGAQASASVWRSVNKNDFTQGAAVGSEKRVRIKMTLGKSNQYAIRSFDAAGAPSAWYYTRIYHPRVIDDKDPKVKYAPGWRHLRNKEAWKDTLTSSAGSHGSARLRFKGSSISLVMFRSANSGKVKIYVDGKAVGKVNLRSNRVQPKRVVANLYYAKRGTHVIELEPLTTGGRGVVFLDGFLVLG